MWNLKYDTSKPIYKTEKDSQTEQTCGCRGGKGVGGEKDGEFGISRYKPLYIGWINNMVLLCSRVLYIQGTIFNIL